MKILKFIKHLAQTILVILFLILYGIGIILGYLVGSAIVVWMIMAFLSFPFKFMWNPSVEPVIILMDKILYTTGLVEWSAVGILFLWIIVKYSWKRAGENK